MKAISRLCASKKTMADRVGVVRNHRYELNANSDQPLIIANRGNSENLDTAKQAHANATAMRMVGISIVQKPTAIKIVPSTAKQAAISPKQIFRIAAAVIVYFKPSLTS
jgi:hypothetical protein